MSNFLNYHFLLVSLTLILSATLIGGNEIPITIEVFYPKGLAVSIPAREGITAFSFRANLNRDIIDTVGADIWTDTARTPVNGHLIVCDLNIRIGIGDVLNYWIYSTRSGKGQRDPKRQLTVTAYTHGSCNQTSISVNSIKVEELIFEEHFSGASLNKSKWSYERRFSSSPDYEFVTYQDDDDVVGIRSGNLFIKPKRRVQNLREKFDFGNDCTGEIGTFDCIRDEKYFDILPPIISAQISTKVSFNFTYGKILVRAKLPDMKWAFPQIYLDSITPGKCNYTSNRMRVAYNLGNSSCVLYGGVNKSCVDLERCVLCCLGNNSWGSAFHVYGLNWTENKISFSVDGRIYCEISTSDKSSTTFDQPLYITLGLGIGGHTNFDDSTPLKPWINFQPQAMSKFWNTMNSLDYPNEELLLDYVKIYSA